MKATIIIKKRNGLYRAKLVNQDNGETVGTFTKGIEAFEDVVHALQRLRDKHHFETFQDKGTYHRFRGYIVDGGLALRSEPYASLQKANQGIEACKKCLEVGMVSLEFSENSDLWHLDQLVNLDLKQFET